MLQPLLFAILSCADGDGGAPAGAPAAVHLESADTGRAADTFAWVDGAQVRVPPSALVELGFTAFAGDPRDWITLGDAPGMTARYDAASGVAQVACSAACFAEQRIGAPTAPAPTAEASTGAFLNTDAVASSIGDATVMAGAFELGVFGPRGFGEATWTAGFGETASAVRLETRWTSDSPTRRLRYRLGDSIARAGAVTDAYRFAGVQVARDFSLEPGFVTTPTPALAGVATMPSVVDLYVDGALRLRERVDAGPFSIVDPPVVTGAGAARIVVTDVLGRQQIITQPFYGGRAMLRPGLTDYSASLGMLRERFAVASNDYGGAIASGVYRRGVTSAVTVEARADATTKQGGAAAGASWTPGLLGQFDASVAQSLGDHAGVIGRFGWARMGPVFSVSADLEAAEPGVTRIGATGAMPRTRSAITAGVSTRYGAVSVSATQADQRADADITTAAIDILPRIASEAVLGFSLLYVNDGADSYAAAVTLSAPLGAARAGSASMSVDHDRLALQARAQQTPPPEGGLGWRLGVRDGDAARVDGALALRGRYGDADIEASRAHGVMGLRAQAAVGLVWIGGGVHVSAPVRDSFALVDARAPGVGVLFENRRVGVTDADGLILLTDLRPYDHNRIGIVIDDLPPGAPLTRDDLDVTPRARSGVIVRFPVDPGAAGEVRIIDEAGAPLPAGLVLTAGARRYPVGRNGRLYVSGVTAPQILHNGGDCTVTIDRTLIGADAPVVCHAP